MLNYRSLLRNIVNRKNKNKRTTRRNNRRLACEALEQRALLAGDLAVMPTDTCVEGEPPLQVELAEAPESEPVEAGYENTDPNMLGIVNVGDLPDGDAIIDVGDLPGGIIDIGDLPDGVRIIDVGDLPDGLFVVEIWKHT